MGFCQQHQGIDSGQHKFAVFISLAVDHCQPMLTAFRLGKPMAARLDANSVLPSNGVNRPTVGHGEEDVVGTAQIGMVQIGTDQIGTAQIGMAQIGTAQIGMAQIGTAQIGMAQIGMAQIGTFAFLAAAFPPLTVERQNLVKVLDHLCRLWKDRRGVRFLLPPNLQAHNRQLVHRVGDVGPVILGHEFFNLGQNLRENLNLHHFRFCFHCDSKIGFSIGLGSAEPRWMENKAKKWNVSTK